MNHIMIDESDLDLGDENDGSLDNKHTIGEMDSSDIMAYSGEISGLNQEMEEQAKTEQKLKNETDRHQLLVQK